MLRLILRLQQLAQPGIILLSMVSFLVVAVGVMQPGAKKLEKLSGKPVEILDLQWGFSQQAARGILAEYTPAALQAAATFLVWADTLYPLVYGTMIALWLAFLFRKGIWQYLVLLPMLVVLVDFAENYWLYKVLTAYPREEGSWILYASLCNGVKWGLLGIAGLACLGGFGNRLYRFLLSVRKVAP